MMLGEASMPLLPLEPIVEATDVHVVVIWAKGCLLELEYGSKGESPSM